MVYDRRGYDRYGFIVADRFTADDRAAVIPCHRCGRVAIARIGRWWRGIRIIIRPRVGTALIRIGLRIPRPVMPCRNATGEVPVIPLPLARTLTHALPQVQRTEFRQSLAGYGMHVRHVFGNVILQLFVGCVGVVYKLVEAR